jgi:hypothetical protein
MSQRVLVAVFGDETDLLRAVSAVRGRGWPVVEAYTPYAVPELDRALGRPRSRLAAACFFCGLLGVGLALGFQFWATAWSWPLNVGGQPWNSLPAFVPVAFETMVLCGGLGMVLAWLLRCRLYPGKTPRLPLKGETDDCFVLVLGDCPSPADAAEIQNFLRDQRALSVEHREE